MPNADRAAVAREVLTEIANAHRELGFTAIVDVMESWRDEHYPAPPAPETVTVAFRDGSTETLYSHGGQWQSGTGLLYDKLIESACLDRIASDARVLKERDARIAELEKELHETRERQLPMVRLRDEAYRQRDAARARIAELETQLQCALDGAVFHKKWAHHAEQEQERDAALRALEAMRLTPAQSAGSLQPTSQGKGLGKINGAEQAPAEEPADRRVTVDAAPAPIPLGAVVEVEGEGGVESWVWDGKLWTSGGGAMEAVRWRALMLTALYHARHPVATRETVERVAEVCMRARHPACFAWDYVTGEINDEWRNIARAALTAAGFTVQEGA